jgi:hypothetical protein
MYKAETLLHAELRLLKIDGDSFQIDKSFMYGLLNKRTVRDIEESNHQLRGQYDAGHEVIQSFFKYNEGLDRPDVRLPHAKYASFKLQTKIGGVQFFQVKAHVFYMPVDTHLNDKDFLQQENPCQFQDKFYETIAARIQKQLLKLISKKKELSKAESDRQFEKFLEEHSLVNPHEMLIICFTFERRFSKISLHKLGLTWNDVKEFYSHDGFLLYMNKLDGSAEHSELLLHSLSLKSLFILFINYILSHCEHEKNILYKTIVIKIPRTLPNAVPQFLKNRWEKFKPSPSVASLKAMVRTTQNLTLVYSGVRRVLGSYFLIKVIKNRLLRQFQVVFYYQFTCRQFVFTLDPSDLGSVISVYLSSITRLILGFNRTKLPKDYQDFYHLLLQKDLIVSKKELASKSLIVRSTSSVITEEKSNQKPFKETSLKVININQNSQNRFKNKEFGAIPKKDKPKILVTSERGSIIEIKDQSIRRDSLNDGSKESSRQSSMENSLKDLWDYTSDLSSKEDLGQYLRHLSQQSRSTALLEFIKELEERTTFSCTVDDNFINNFDKTRKPSKRFIKVWNGIEAGLRKVKEFEDHLVMSHNRSFGS